MSTPHLQAEALPSDEPKPCRLAEWSMVCGILGLMTCPLLLLGITAVVLGHMALSRIKGSGGTLTRGGQARAGLVMGYASVAIAFLIIVGGSSHRGARERAQASTILHEVRQLDSAKFGYALENNTTNTPLFADLTPYLKAGSKLATNDGKDSFGNPFDMGPYGKRVRVHAETQRTLSAATGGGAFWGPYS